MGLRDTFLNMLGAETPEVQRTDNSVYKSARDFLRYGNREKLYPDWSDVKMADSDMYRGYSYAVIQKRSNKVASLAKENLSTWAKPEIVDAYQKKNETVLHPYLKLIEDSTKFSEKQFWKTISIYLDLAGRYYLGVVRTQVRPTNPNLPVITTDPTEFVMLNPYEIRRVVDKDKHVAGYIERKKDGRYREWPLWQIIEMRELNPFDPENGQWAMTDAAKEAVYTINQSGDYTRQSLHGNIEAPGIITTDVLLNDEDFANFRERVTQHTKGEPLFGNGTGAIKWDSMQIDLDKAALMDINEINRTTLFAVSGTSKTSLGIEQSGTTRETARVQSEQFVSDTAQPRLEDIVDFLNLDYRKNYFNEYRQTGYYIEIKSAVGRDYDTEQKAVALKQSQFQLAMQLIQSGYTTETAYQFAEGSIDFADLELEKGLDKPINPEEPEGGDETPSNSPNNGPQSGSGGGDDTNPTSQSNNALEAKNDEKLAELNELEPHSDLQEGEKSDPLEVIEVDEPCTCEHDHKVETFINEVKPEESKIIKDAYDDFLEEVRAIEKETINAVARKLTTNAFDQDDLIGKRKKASLTEKFKNAIKDYWWLLLPLLANNDMGKRNEEFGKNVIFTFDNALQKKVIDNAERVAEGHMNTVLDDILETSNKVYTQILEGAAADLIIRAYEDNPSKYEAYFSEKPTRADALKSIQNTDILEKNKKIYDRANKMAFEGYKRGDIVKAVRAEYKDISENRATLIARNETARAFGKSQFEADKQFLNSIGKMEQAYKVWYSRRPLSEQDKICPFCRELIDRTNANPIPFDEPFIKYGDSMEVVENGKVKIFTADYENIEGSTLHPNCSCGYKLVFKNSDGTFTKTLNGGQGSGNFGHSGRPGEQGGSAPQGSYTSGKDLFNAKIGNKLEAFKQLTPEEQAVFCEKAMEIEYSDMPQDLANTDFQRISYALGLKDKPKVVGDEEFAKSIENGKEEFFRAVKGNGSLTPSQVAERLYTGEYVYQGNGDYCDGTYFTPDWGAMEYYLGPSVNTSDSAVIRCSIDLDANIYYQDPGKPFDGKMVHTMNVLEQKTGMKQNTARAVALLAEGYDGYSFINGGSRKEYLCMLNRKYLTVNKENILAIKSEYEGGDDVE